MYHGRISTLGNGKPSVAPRHLFSLKRSPMTAVPLLNLRPMAAHPRTFRSQHIARSLPLLHVDGVRPTHGASPPGASDVLYLVDFLGYVFRAYHAIAPLSSPTGEPTHATYGTIAMLSKLMAEERKPHFLAWPMDSAPGSRVRTGMDARYKAHRPAAAGRPGGADEALQPSSSKPIRFRPSRPTAWRPTM